MKVSVRVHPTLTLGQPWWWAKHQIWTLLLPGFQNCPSEHSHWAVKWAVNCCVKWDLKHRSARDNFANLSVFSFIPVLQLVVQGTRQCCNVAAHMINQKIHALPLGKGHKHECFIYHPSPTLYMLLAHAIDPHTPTCGYPLSSNIVCMFQQAS
jgi:hypothetical protein